MSTSKIISQDRTLWQTLEAEGLPPAALSPLLLPIKKKNRNLKNVIIYHSIYFVSGALCVTSSYRLFFRTAQTRDNYSFGTMMSYNPIP